METPSAVLSRLVRSFIVSQETKEVCNRMKDLCSAIPRDVSNHTQEPSFTLCHGTFACWRH